MRINRLVLLAAGATALVVALSLSAVSAQEMVTCDADLILALYYAERFYDFSALAGQSAMAVDLDSFDKGQFAPLFDRAAGEPAAVQMSDELRSRVLELMAMSDADFDAEVAGADVSAMTLSPGDVMDESDECAALRSALRRFFTGLAFAEAELGGISAGAEAAAPAATEEPGTTETGAIIVDLTGAAEVPGPGDEDAAGTAAVYLRGESNEVCVDIIVEKMTLPATAAHIHEGAAGESGPPVVTLTAPDATGVSNTCATVDDAELMQELIINPENFYVNVHNADFPDGAARGQMHSAAAGAGTEPATTGTTDTGAANAMIVDLTGAAEAPGPGDEDASGQAAIYLRGNRNEVCVDIIVEDMTLPATAAHIHVGAAGESGPPVVPLTAPDATGVSNTCATVEAELMQELIDNPQDYYVNVHNADFPDGAARGQMH